MQDEKITEELLAPHEKLKNYFQSKHIKQASVARATGIAVGTLGDLLNGRMTKDGKFTKEVMDKYVSRLEKELGFKFCEL